MRTRVLVLALVIAWAGRADAQPHSFGWRPPTGCSATNVIQWSGSAWTCGAASAISGLTTNTITKATSATAIGNSLLTDNATTLAYNTDKFTVTAATGAALIAGLATITGGVTTPANLTTTGTGALVVAGTGTIGSTLDVGANMYMAGNEFHGQSGTNAEADVYWNYFSNGATGTAYFRNSIIGDGKGAIACAVTGSTKSLNCVGGLQENGTAVLSGAITANRLPKGSGGDLTDSNISDDGTTFAVNSPLNLFAGSGGTFGTYMNGTTVNGAYSTNALADIGFNYTGYAGGTTQFRNVVIYGGKSAAVATFDGSAKSLAVTGNLSTDANLTAGNSTDADSHTVRGPVLFQSSGTNGVRVGAEFGTGSYGLSIQGVQDNNANASIMSNAYALFSNTTTPTYKWDTTHGSYGSRGIEFTNGLGIQFYADGVATTADSTFTPTTRMVIANGGNVGVGTDTTPDYLLDVQGTFNADGAATFLSTLTATAAAATFGDFRGTVLHPTAITGTNNDYAPTGYATATTIVLTTSGEATLTGLAGGSDGRVVNLCSYASHGIILVNESASSTAANRFVFADSTDRTFLLNSAGCIALQWRTDDDRWHPIETNEIAKLHVSSNLVLYSDAHIVNAAGATGPTLSSCGTSPTIEGSDTAGVITLGSGTATSCTVTFATAYTSNEPSCVVVSEIATRGDLYISAKSTTAFTVSNVAGANMAAGQINYHCIGTTIGAYAQNR